MYKSNFRELTVPVVSGLLRGKNNLKKTMIEFEATTKNTRKHPVIFTQCFCFAAVTDLPSVVVGPCLLIQQPP